MQDNILNLFKHIYKAKQYLTFKFDISNRKDLRKTSNKYNYNLF